MSDSRTYTPSERVVHALETVGAALAVANARDRGYLVAGLRRLIGVQSYAKEPERAKLPSKDPKSIRTQEHDTEEYKSRQNCLEAIRKEIQKLGVQKLDDSHELVRELKERTEALKRKREELRKAAGLRPLPADEQKEGSKEPPHRPVTRAVAAAKAAAKAPGSPKTTATSSKSTGTYKSTSSTKT